MRPSAALVLDDRSFSKMIGLLLALPTALIAPFIATGLFWIVPFHLRLTDGISLAAASLVLIAAGGALLVSKRTRGIGLGLLIGAVGYEVFINWLFRIWSEGLLGI